MPAKKRKTTRQRRRSKARSASANTAALRKVSKERDQARRKLRAAQKKLA
ncbi:putative DNA-binding protein, partial [Coxiella burnetii Q321]